MRIEKVNENQIRCVLTREDLADRQIKLSELAYGSEKAKTLFREMIQQANYEVGFEVDDVPLMVEAIPVSAESIILVITKVEYPEELDTRFSKFTEADEDTFTEDSQANGLPEEKFKATDVIEFFDKLRREAKKLKDEDAKKEQETATSEKAPEEKKETAPVVIESDITKMFEFKNLDQVERLAHVLNGFYDGVNSLYKDEVKGRYYLLVHKSDLSPEVFNKVCNIISEYAFQRNYNSAKGAHFEEHCKGIIKGNALSVLASL